MKLETTIEYSESYIPPRCRKPRWRDVKEDVVLDVAEHTDQTAPVVGIVHDWVWPDNDDGRLVPTDVRKVGDVFYVPLLLKDIVCTKTDRERHLTADELIDHIKHRVSYGHYGNGERGDVLEHCDYVLSLYAVIDGMAWQATGEPRYVINTFGLGHNHGGTGFFIEFSYNSNIAASRYFNANDRDKAIEAFMNIALGRGNTASAQRIQHELDCGECRNIEVLVPDAFACNPLTEHGEGDEFINGLESLISGSGSSLEAGLLVMASTFAELSDSTAA